MSTFSCTDPEKQFLLLINHVNMIRKKVHWISSMVHVFVEHNLGFEVLVYVHTYSCNSWAFVCTVMHSWAQ